MALGRAVGIWGGGGHGGRAPPPPNNLQKGEGFYSANTVLLITKVCHFKKNYVCPPPICVCPPPICNCFLRACKGLPFCLLYLLNFILIKKNAEQFSKKPCLICLNFLLQRLVNVYRGSYMRDHVLLISPAGKGLTSWLSFVVSSVSLSLPHWYPGSGVVLNCIDS